MNSSSKEQTMSSNFDRDDDNFTTDRDDFPDIPSICKHNSYMISYANGEQ